MITRKIAIAVCYHLEQDKYMDNQYCIPVQVGSEYAKVDMGIQKDNEGDNCSDRNPLYCELTAAYWLWKNVDAEYKGLFHHRRMFTIENISPLRRLLKYASMVKYYVINLFKFQPVGYSDKIECPSDKEYYDKADSFLSYLSKCLRGGAVRHCCTQKTMHIS